MGQERRDIVVDLQELAARLEIVVDQSEKFVGVEHMIKDLKRAYDVETTGIEQSLAQHIVDNSRSNMRRRMRNRRRSWLNADGVEPPVQGACQEIAAGAADLEKPRRGRGVGDGRDFIDVIVRHVVDLSFVDEGTVAVKIKSCPERRWDSNR